jgi:hypothetical protein
VPGDHIDEDQLAGRSIRGELRGLPLQRLVTGPFVAGRRQDRHLTWVPVFEPITGYLGREPWLRGQGKRSNPEAESQQQRGTIKDRRGGEGDRRRE